MMRQSLLDLRHIEAGLDASMNPESRPGVALLVEASRAYGRELLRGAALFARTHAICLLCDPPLSSVRPDAERVGYRAAELLHQMIAGTDMTLEQIAPIAGYSHKERLSTVFKRFKRETGETPGEYRRKAGLDAAKRWKDT